MTDLTDLAQQHQDLPEDEQKQIAAAIPGAMKREHEQFMLRLVKLLDDGVIDLYKTDSLLNTDVSDGLAEDARGQVDLSLLNILGQVRQIYEFYKSEKTPNASPHLQTMVEHLWQQKSKLEDQYGDVLKI